VLCGAIQEVPQCPKDANSFYLQQLQHPTPTCWYSTHPLGHNTAPWQNSASLGGFKTNPCWGLQLPVDYTDLALMNSWLWKGPDIEAWKESAPKNAHLMTNVKHSLTSSTGQKLHHIFRQYHFNRSQIMIFLQPLPVLSAVCPVLVSVWENKQPSSPHSLTSLVVSTCLEQTSLWTSTLAHRTRSCHVEGNDYGHVFRFRLTTLF